ncbi:response regulator [Pseudoduganella umbonata]|uniref:histidine kinase n=1 Tax=Pseudoduganella umbonata TaxID=864828 RepID=A0A4P8HU78_9BURK|nr:response regulator [Pseudoduganella umbonata]MBB3223618.1 signal transduction histidine kinase [Pseudoduganella umbonata]QCP13519.1 response regulator [Pseudoduganella umbonata]
MKAPPHDPVILNVDDTDAARYAKTRILQRAGFRVLEAGSGAEALRMAHEASPDLVLLDTKLPDINGFEVCRQLKQDPLTAMVLVLQTSASYLSSPDKVRALDSGADNYLFEPIEPEELVANVRALLRLGRVERELRDVDRRKDEFLAILAHELRNPLGPIRNAVELLRSLDPHSSPAQENARRVILRQTDHMVRLVDDLLDVSRISQGKITLRRAQVELCGLLRSAAETAEPNIAARQHVLTVKLPDHEIWVDGDSVRLTQVVGNLLNNAAKFTAPGGRIALAACLEGDEAVIRVTDNGIGIPAEQAETIFDLFAQAGHSPDRVQDGLGIGLSLVRTLVNLHGGDVSVHSEGTGEGSTFEVRLPTLPRTPAADESDCIVPAAAPARPADAHRILVVDDNVDSAEIVAALLQFTGHEVHMAHDGASAIEAALRLRPDVVFLDIGLPDMSGVDVAATLRTYPELEKTVLIALTGYGQDKDRMGAMAAGFNHHLTKPVNMETLNDTVRTFMRKQ